MRYILSLWIEMIFQFFGNLIYVLYLGWGSVFCLYFFREEAEELILTLRNHNVPLVIFSAGIGNVIDFFLQKTLGGFPNNVHIVSNMMVIVSSTFQK